MLRDCVRLYYSLFSGVVKLVLVGASEALLYAVVRPQSLHGSKQLVRERLGVFHACYDVHHHLGVGLHANNTSATVRSNQFVQECHIVDR